MYRVTVADECGVFSSLDAATFHEALEKYRKILAQNNPDIAVRISNAEREDAEFDGERWVTKDGLTEEEREQL